ncbi:hypothetical protein [uncultured Eudoraea sp.]|uniref:hypothetical protein n=1 Tax=uncultured Eudoraea sp. TaxID=1035614 RepID=UPI002617D85E|nr:hypothetical protein [uncultured Eudoraea sp.]
MSSAGHILDMIKRIRQNRSLQPSKKQKFKGSNREQIYSDKLNPEDQAKFKIVSEEKLNELKLQIRERAKKERKEEMILFAIFLVVGLIITIAFILYN